MAQKRPRCAYRNCGKQFRADRASQLYCIPKHGQAERRLRKAEESTNGHRAEPNEGRFYNAFKDRLNPGADIDITTDDDEYMDGMVEVLLPDGPPPPRPRPEPSRRDDTPAGEIVIHNVPTRFPGTPLYRGRQH